MLRTPLRIFLFCNYLLEAKWLFLIQNIAELFLGLSISSAEYHLPESSTSHTGQPKTATTTVLTVVQIVSNHALKLT